MNQKKSEKDTVTKEYKTKIKEEDSLFMENIGLETRLSALHDLAYADYRSFIGEKDTWLDYITLHRIWYYLFCSPIGLIMLLFILIDISPVLYKMMLADGRYDNYLHQEKLLAQDRIRLKLAEMLKGLNDSDLKNVAPFIIGDIYEKMSEESVLFKTEEELRKQLENDVSGQQKITWKERIFGKKLKRLPSLIVLETKKTPMQAEVEKVNMEIFTEVLGLKRDIVIASYRRWYKTQHDAIIGDPIDDEFAGKEPFDKSK